MDKSDIGPIPAGFEESGISLDGIFGKYQQSRGNELITIWEYPTHYQVQVTQRNQSGPDIGPHNNQSLDTNAQTRSSQNGESPLAEALGLVIAGGTAYAGLKGLEKLFGSEQRTYKVFISHSWDYSDQIERLEQFLNSADDFEWHDYSVWETDPLDAPTDPELKQALRKQIKPASVVLILSGMYASHSKWINEEIRIANQMDKPIIGIQPWGNERVPKAVKQNADEIVGWNTKSIIRAIEEHSP